jgi:outer membrane murein-binding lipoprotein Lpp
VARLRDETTGGLMAATTDQLLAEIRRLTSKVDVLLTEMGIQMAISDDIQAATTVITEEVAALNTAHDALAAAIEQLRTQVAAGQVDPAIVANFESVLSTLKPSVDNIAALVPVEPPVTG